MIRAAEPPTIREIAHAVGVTPTTVSLALRDSPRISSRTRMRVKRTADDMGYRPNAELSRVMMQLKTRGRSDIRPVIALIRPGSRPAAADDPLRTAFQTLSENAGFATDEIHMGRDNMRLERLADVLRNRGIRGGILYRVEEPAPANADWMQGLALCCVGDPPAGAPLPACDWSNPAPGRPETPLLRTALDYLSFLLRQNRLGMPEDHIRITVMPSSNA